MRLKVFSPSVELASVDIGGLFVASDGKRYMLIARDPWKAKIARYTKLDEFVVNLIDRFKRKTK